MRDLFDRLLAEGEAGIDRLIAEATQETLQLDFKRKEVDRNGEFSTNDRQILAQTLSGFANSAGGLVIFGVYARKGQDLIDCAQSAHPIGDIRRFLAEANTEVGRLVQPRLDDVSIEAIASQRIPGAGYLLVYTPRSNRRPHRSEAKNQKGYYKRVGDSFFEMEHYDIEDAFSRSSHAVLEGFTEKCGSLPLPQSYGREFLFAIGLKNVSDVTAKLPFIAVSNLINCRQSSYGTDYEGIIARGHGDVNYYHGNQNFVIYPGQSSAMLRLAIAAEQAGMDYMVGGRPDLITEVSLTMRYGCENGRSKSIRLAFPAAAIIRAG